MIMCGHFFENGFFFKLHDVGTKSELEKMRDSSLRNISNYYYVKSEANLSQYTIQSACLKQICMVTLDIDKTFPASI